MADNKIPVGGRLHSIATGNVLAGADEILDESKNKKQSDINTETYSLVNDINERLSGLSPDQQSALSVATKATNNETKLGYYVCDTPAATAAKVISATGYVLSLGGSIKVKMTNANTAANATLNINSTGAKPLYYDGERASANNSWEAGETVEVYYDGTNFYANNVAGSGSGDGVFDVSAKTGDTYETLSAALSAANSILSANRKKGGMSIKFQQLTSATYSVVKIEGVETLPTGTEVESALSLTDGEYTASQLSEVATLPSAVGSSVTYFLAVEETVESETVTTYTTWKITMESSNGVKYVQYRLMATSWSSNEKDWENLETSDIRKKIFLKDLLTYTRNTAHKKAADADTGSFFDNYGGSSATWYMSDLIDVRAISQLRCKGYAPGPSSTTGLFLLLRAQDINGNYIAENSVANIDNSRTNEFIWTKQDGTTHVRVFFNTSKPFYAYLYPIVDDISDLKDSIDVINEDISTINEDISTINEDISTINEDIEHVLDVNNLLDTEKFLSYNKANRRVLRGDTGSYSGVNNFGNDYVYYAVWEFINVSTIKQLKYSLPFPNKITSAIPSGNVALLAAYNKDKVYIPENSIIIDSMSKVNEGIWTKGENTFYINFTVFYNNGNGKFYGTVLNIGSELEKIKDDIENLQNNTNKTDINNLNQDRESAIINLSYRADTLKILFFSDLHDHPANVERILSFYNKHKTYIDEIINGGDTVNTNYTNPIGYGEVEGVEKILNVIGNHDIYDGSTYSHSGIDGYNKIIKPYIKTEIDGVETDNWNVVQPENAEINGYCFYYKDYATSGIRVIILDSIKEFTENSYQRTWFQTVLAEAITNNLAVVVVCHWLYADKKAIKTHFSTWADKDAVGASSSRFITADVDTFIKNGGNFCCYLIGHSHLDYISVLDDYPAQICIMVDAANGRDKSETLQVNHSGVVRIVGSRSQDSFDVIGINKTTKQITVIKIGVDTNIYGQKTDSVVIDYETKKEVFSNYTEG